MTLPFSLQLYNEQCEAWLRAAASLLPIPDPQIFRLPGPWDPTTGTEVAAERGSLLVERTIEERNKTLTAASDEIWFVIGDWVGGGYAPYDQITGLSYRVAASGGGANAVVTAAHEAGHMFGQHHVALCGADGDSPTSLPDDGNVVVIGWDMWNNTPVRGKIDLMSYCFAQAWMSPERWRRIFLQVGP